MSVGMAGSMTILLRLCSGRNDPRRLMRSLDRARIHQSCHKVLGWVRTRVGHRGRQRAECGIGSIDDGIDIEHSLLTTLGKRYVTYLGKASYFETTLKLRQIVIFEQGYGERV